MLRTRASWSKACLLIKQFAIYNISLVLATVSVSVSYIFVLGKSDKHLSTPGTTPGLQKANIHCDCVPTCLGHVSCDSVHAVSFIITKATAFLTSSIVTSMCIFEARSMGCQCGTGLCRTLLKDSAHLFPCLFSPFDNVDPYLALVGPVRTLVLPVIFLTMRCTCQTSFVGAAFIALCACPSSLSRMSF